MSVLEIVRAGAGSGKTTDLCETVAAAVTAGLDPARVLATTFTRKASAELKSRIQQKLLAETGVPASDAHRRADRLELAAIGTVHSVALQLLSRYAIPMGLSPRLRVLTEAASERTLSDLLGTLPEDTWHQLARTAHRLSVTDLKDRILKLVAAKRGNRIADEDFRSHICAGAERVCQLLAPDGGQSVAPAGQFRELVEQALAGLDSLTNDTQQNTEAARQRLRVLKSRGGSVWQTHVQATKITAGKRSGANAMLDELRQFAAAVGENPELHADVREFAVLLAAEAMQLGEKYETYKRERGLVDFTDLEILLLELLEQDDTAASVATDHDLVLVDEFQDTNPLQLAIFQRLRQLASRSRWVGDPKQAIYGFRGTDPTLVHSVWHAVPKTQHTELPCNHRSQRGLVQLVGKLFEPVFGPEAVQQPKKSGGERGIERWLLQSNNQAADAAAIARGIDELHNEGHRYGDIAVLERTNHALETLTKALDQLGIPYLLGSPGLLSTREGVALLAGLRLVADRGDSLAAATILHVLEDGALPTPAWLDERLKALKESSKPAGETGSAAYTAPWAGDPRFAELERIDRQTLAPLLVAQQVIEAIGLPTHIARWGDAARRSAHLDSLLQHVNEYQDVAAETGVPPTLNGLILYFEELAASDKDVRHPPLGHNAVTLSTYHSAKGLEWPIVVLSGLHAEKDPDMWSPSVSGGGAAEGDPLAGRTLRAWIWPFGYTEGPYGGLVKGSGLETRALGCPEGQQQATLAQEENLRLLYVGCTRAKDKLVFAHRPGKYNWLARLDQLDALLGTSDEAGEFPLDEIDTKLVIRTLGTVTATASQAPAETREPWLSVPTVSATGPFAPRYYYPSEAAAAAGEYLPSEFHELDAMVHFPSGKNQEQYSAIGNAVHGYLAALPSLRSLDPAQYKAVAERCLANYSATGLLAPTVLVAAGEHFCTWVEQQWPRATWATEVPVTGPRAAGGQWIGTIDLVLELENGALVLVDHKSAPVLRDYVLEEADRFVGQLQAYQEILEAAGHVVEAVFVHLPLAGVVVSLDN